MRARGLPALALVAVSLLAAGCPRGGAPRGGATSPTPADDAPVALDTLAAELDPGEVPPLLEGAPPGLAELLVGRRPLVPDQARLRRAIQLLAGTTASDSASVARLLMLLYEATIELERKADTCDVECLGLLEQVYRILDAPFLAGEQGIFAQLIDAVAQAASPDGGAAMASYLRQVFSRARLRHRYVAVRLLRRAPGSREALEALRALGRAATRDDEHDLARRIAATVVARAPAAERPADVVTLARACYLSLRVACGDRHVAASRAAAANDAAIATSVTDAEASGVRARAAAALVDEEGIEPRLRLGHALIDLGRRAHAIEVFVDLARAHPRDARPLVGEARARFDLAAGGVASDKLLRRASKLENRDRRFYEMAVGTAAMGLLPVIQRLALAPDTGQDEIIARMAEALMPLRTDLEGLGRFDPGRAAVIDVMMDGAAAVLAIRKDADAAARTRAADRARADVISRAQAVRQQFPGELAAHQLALMATRFSNTVTPEIEAIIVAPIPAGAPSRAQLLEVRAVASAGLAIGHGQERLLERHLAIAAELPVEGATWQTRNLRAEAAALAATARKSGWAEVEASTRALLAEAPDDAERARLTNNLGVALHHQNRAAEARAAWTEASGMGGEMPVADVNLAAAGGGDAAVLARLDQLAADAPRFGIQFQAAAWRRHFARARGEKQPTIAELRRTTAEIFDSAFAVADGRLGAVPDESFQVSLGYSSTSGLVLDFPIQSKLWLILPAPGT